MTFDWPTAGTVEVTAYVSATGNQATRPATSAAAARQRKQLAYLDQFAAELTAAGRRAIAVDLRGHATSDRNCRLLPHRYPR